MEEKPTSTAGGTEPSKEQKRTSPHVPPSVASQADAVDVGASSAPKKIRPFYEDLYWSKRFWLLVVLLGFFVYITTAVPVSKIPFLRNLVEAMGYTEPETHKISFFKALLTWNEHTKHVKAQEAEELQARQSTATAVGGAMESAQLNKSRLFEFKEFNASLKEEGKLAMDAVTKAGGNEVASKEAQSVQMSGKETKVATQPSADELPKEIFFMEERGQVQRDPETGFDSTKQLAEVNSPGTIDSSRTDWLLDQANSYWSRQGGIIFNNKLLDVGDIASTPGQQILTVGEVKPQIDVIYAWMTSRASRRTENKALKQTLNSAGFIGADLSRPMLLTGMDGVGSVPLDPKKMRIDMTDAKDRLKLEKECSAVLDNNSAQKRAIIENLSEANKVRDALPGYLESCKKVLDEGGADAFNSAVDEMIQKCKNVNSAYAPIRSKCQMSVIDGSCDAKNLQSLAVTAKDSCNESVESCMNQKIAQYQQAHGGNPPTSDEKKQIREGCLVIATSKMKEKVGDIKEAVSEVINPTPGKKGFFAMVDWIATMSNRQFSEQN